MADKTSVNKEDLKKQASTLVELDFPPQIMIEPVNWCNLNCIMCPSDKLTRDRGMMDLNLFKKIADEIASENPATKLWPAVMGEPLLAGERLFEILDYAREKSIPVHLNTNAVLLTDYSIAKLKELEIKEVIVGIDAFTEKTYNMIRRQGDFDRVCLNIRKMLNEFSGSPKVILQYIAMDENEHELDDFKKYWLEKGAIVKTRIKQGWGDLVGSDLLTLKQEERNMPCPWLNRNFEILWNGDICQCDGDMDNQYCCGNVNDQTIKEIWQGKMRDIREKHYKGDFDFEPCKSCKDWQVGLSKFYYPDDPNNPRIVDER